jgi:hypothetical protein
MQDHGAPRTGTAMAPPGTHPSPAGVRDAAAARVNRSRPAARWAGPRAGVAPGLWWWLAICLLILGATPAAAHSPQPRVVILDSYHPGYTWSDEELAGVLASLHQGYPEIEPSIEYLDTKRFPGPDHLERMRAYLAGKYRPGHHPGQRGPGTGAALPA